MSYTYDTLNRLSTVVDNNLPAGQNTTTYAYDTASNLVTVTYPNQLQSTIQYDSLNRLTSLNTAPPNSSPVAGYSYTLGSTGNRTGAVEGNGRTLTWNYDGIYRLTNESVSNDPNSNNGSVGYDLDPVGNRTSVNSTLPGVASVSITGFNADDWMSPETYDSNGNTLTTGGKSFSYDSENHLMSMNGGTVKLIYDGDGNRVAKIANGVTTQYLVDDLNPTGYAQVVDEVVNGAVQRQYTYGLQRISEAQSISGTWTPSFYGYDGGGSVRQLTNAAAAVTDTYNYDAFGNLLNSTGTTPNNYLYRGEQYDSDLGLYYLRARYYNPQTGRFLSRDPEDGQPVDPKTLHKYLYAGGDPVNGIDPLGRSMLETGSLDIEMDESAFPALRELAGGAYASAESYVVSAYLTAAENAASAWAAITDWAEAMDVIGTAKGLTKVFLCSAAQVALGTVLNKATGSGISAGLPSAIKIQFVTKCVVLLNGLFP